MINWNTFLKAFDMLTYIVIFQENKRTWSLTRLGMRACRPRALREVLRMVENIYLSQGRYTRKSVKAKTRVRSASKANLTETHCGSQAHPPNPRWEDH